MRVTRETVPEAIDKLERRKLEVEIHALELEKDDASKERLKIARKTIAHVEEQLAPLKAQYEAEKRRGDETANLRRTIGELKAKADEAERRYDLATAPDLRYYALHDLTRLCIVHAASVLVGPCNEHGCARGSDPPPSSGLADYPLHPQLTSYGPHFHRKRAAQNE